MRKRFAKLPSPAMTVALLALIAGLTGTAVALPGSNSVTSGDIRNGAVRSSDIRNNNVRGGDIRNGSVGGGDVANNSLTGNDVNEDSLGTVPSAATANRANSANSAGTAASAGSANVAGFAGNAGAVDGASIASIDFRVGPQVPGDEDTVIFDQGGLQLTANCISDDITLNAINTSGGVGSLYVDGIAEGADEVDYEQFDQFDPGDINLIEVTFYPNDTDTNATLYYSNPDGGNVTAHLHYEENAQVSPGQTGCAITGYAVVTG